MEEDVELQIGTEKKILIIHKTGQFLQLSAIFWAILSSFCFLVGKNSLIQHVSDIFIVKNIDATFSFTTWFS
jgi:hypothetical protein